MSRFPATAYLPMTEVRASNCILMLMFAVGLADGGGGARDVDPALFLVIGLAIHYLAFLWYGSDSNARGFVRSRLLSVAVFVFPLAAVPYYLLRSRPAGERWPALRSFTGLLLGMPVACCVGIGIHLAIRHAGS